MPNCIHVPITRSVTRVAHPVEIKVLSDGPLKPALVKIAEAFRRESGHEVKVVFGQSSVIHKKIVDGETGDVIIIQPDFVDDLVKAGKVVAGRHPIIARIGIGLFGLADGHAQDISTPELLKRALLRADTVVFNNVASGNVFVKVLERLGIAAAMKDKIARTSPADVAVRVLHGQGNDIGVGTMTLITADKRLKLIGALPSVLQTDIVYIAAKTTNAQQPETANAFIKTLTSQKSKETFAAAGAN